MAKRKKTSSTKSKRTWVIARPIALFFVGVALAAGASSIFNLSLSSFLSGDKECASAYIEGIGCADQIVIEQTNAEGEVITIRLGDIAEDRGEGADNISVETAIERLSNMFMPEPRSTISGRYLAARFAAVHNDNARSSTEINGILDMTEGSPDDFVLNRAFHSFLANREFEKAIETAYMIGQDNPLISNLANTLQLAEAFRLGDTDTAQALIENYSTVGFSDYIKPLAQSWQFIALSEGDKALNFIVKRKDMHPSMKAVYTLHRAFILDYLGNKDQAAKAYDQVLDEYLSVRTAFIALNFYERQQNLGKIEAILDELGEFPSQTIFVNQVKKRIEEGRFQTKPFVETPSDGIKAAIYDLASVLNQEHSSRLALLYARITEYLDADAPMMKLLMGDILADIEQYQEAASYFLSIKNDNDFFVLSRFELARISEKLNNIKEAIAYMQEVVSMNGQDDIVSMKIGDLLRYDSRFEEAIPYYTAIIDKIDEAERDDWAVYYSRGICYEQSDQWELAEKDLQKALELNPSQPFALNYLGYSWADKGLNIDEALELITKALTIRPNDGYIIDSMGWVLYRTGRISEALDYLEKAVMLVPDDPTINDHLGDVYWSVGRKVEAIYQWERAIRYAENGDDINISTIEDKILNDYTPSAHKLIEQASEKKNGDILHE